MTISKQHVLITIIFLSAILTLGGCCRKCSKSPSDTFGNNSHIAKNGDVIYANCDLYTNEQMTTIIADDAHITLKSVYKSKGDHDARNPVLIVSLPVESEIISFNAFIGNYQIPSKQCKSFIQCDPSQNVRVNGELTVTVKAKKPRLEIDHCTFGNYCTPEFPSDLDPTNNEFS